MGSFFQQKASCGRVCCTTAVEVHQDFAWTDMGSALSVHMPVTPGFSLFLLLQRPRQAAWNLVRGVRAGGGMVEWLLSEQVLYLQPLNVFTIWLCHKHEKKGRLHKHVYMHVTAWVRACMHTRT